MKEIKLVAVEHTPRGIVILHGEDGTTLTGTTRQLAEQMVLDPGMWTALKAHVQAVEHLSLNKG